MMEMILDQRIECFFFDIGSVLVRGPNLSPNREIAKFLNLPHIDVDQIGHIIMREDFNNPEEVYERLKAEWKEIDSSCKDKIKELWNQQENDANEIEGATEIIQYLKKRGYKIGLISDIWIPYYRSFEKACPEIAAIVDSVTLSFKEGVKKPDTDLFRKALSSLSTFPELAVIVGDTYKNDMYPAIELHMHTIWLLSRPEREVEAVANVINGKWPKPDYVITDISILKTIDHFWEKQ